MVSSLPNYFTDLKYGAKVLHLKNGEIANKALRIISFKHTRSLVNPLYSKCEILNFADNIKLSNSLFAHDSIKCNLPTSLCDSITLVNKHSHTSRNQEANQVNIPTVRSKTSGSNSIKSKSANIWNYLNKLFHSKQLIHQKSSFCKSLLKGYL